MDDLEQPPGAPPTVTRGMARRARSLPDLAAGPRLLRPLRAPTRRDRSSVAGTLGVVAAITVVVVSVATLTLMVLVGLGVINVRPPLAHLPVASAPPALPKPLPDDDPQATTLFGRASPPGDSYVGSPQTPGAPAASGYYASPEEAMLLTARRVDATHIHVAGHNLSSRPIVAAQFSLFGRTESRAIHTFRCDLLPAGAGIDQELEVRSLASVPMSEPLRLALTTGRFE